jgi:hypothetical protein
MLKQLVCAAGMALATVATPLPLRAPQVGVIRDAAHNLRLVYGFSGNLITGDPLPVQDVLAASFSDDAGIVLTPGAIKLISAAGAERGSYPTEEVQPVLGIAGAEDTAAAWLPSEGKLIRWNGSAFTALPVSASDVPGPVVGIETTDRDSIDFFIRTQTDAVDVFRLSLKTGTANRITTYTGASGPAIAAGNAVVFPSTEGLQVASSVRPVEFVALPDSHVTIEKAAPDWVHVASPANHRDWMLHIDRAHPTLSELPAVQPLRMPGEAAR